MPQYRLFESTGAKDTFKLVKDEIEAATPDAAVDAYMDKKKLESFDGYAAPTRTLSRQDVATQTETVKKKVRGGAAPKKKPTANGRKKAQKSGVKQSAQEPQKDDKGGNPFLDDKAGDSA